MATDAQCALFETAQIKDVRSVAIGAFGLRRVECPFGVRLVVTVGASVRELSDAFGVRFMTGNAVGFCTDGGMRRGNVRMTACAGGIRRSSYGMRSVTACAIAMRGRFVLCEDLGVLMACGAPQSAGR